MKGLYAIVDTQSLALRGVEAVAFAREVLASRPTALQLRAKGLPPREVLGLLRALLPECRRFGVRLFANDRPDLAALAGCDGVHVGQHDMPVEQVRRIAPRLAIGVSTHDGAQLERALAQKPDYVAYGPVFATTTKIPQPGCPVDSVVGLRGLGAAAARCAGTGIPLVAIGGITLGNVRDIAIFADAAAVISGVYGDGPVDLPSVGRRARSFQSAFLTRSDSALAGAPGGGGFLDSGVDGRPIDPTVLDAPDAALNPESRDFERLSETALPDSERGKPAARINV